MDENNAKVQGQLLTLFGEPAYITKDLENAYAYVVIAKIGDSKEIVLSVYCGPTGPAIGGKWGADGVAEAAEKLRTFILVAQPTDYEYEGFYFDGPMRIRQGVKDGNAYFFESEMTDEEFKEAYQEVHQIRE